jgi:hypothetical protein
MIADRFSSVSRQLWISAGVFLLGGLLIIPVQNRFKDRLGEDVPDPDVLYFSSPSLVKKMALGYETILADVYWLRTIQYFGRREEAMRREVPYKNLAAFLDITTTLDPDLIDAYRYGSSYLAFESPMGAGQPAEAVKLLGKGIEAHPGMWELRLDKGFVYYWFLSDFKAAGDVWLEASRLPGSPNWMGPLAAMSLSKGGSIELARALWKQQYDSATRADIRENARNCLMSLQVAEDLWTLEYLLGVYRLEHGSSPRNLLELASGWPRELKTVDPLGTPYLYDRQTGEVSLSPDSRIRTVEIPRQYKEGFLSQLVK